MKSIYKIEFTYTASPRKIPLPFVGYKPNQTIWNFEKILSQEEKEKIVKIGKDLNEARGTSVEYMEFLYSENQKQWVMLAG